MTNKQKLAIITSQFIFTACPPPPPLENGTPIDETRRVLVGSIFNYTCNDSYIPVGEFSDQLSTKCLENGSYSHDSSSLATCAPNISTLLILK